MKVTKNLLEIDPEQLFKENTTAELQNVHKEIQLEIEKKREELRTSVGERYRDLLKAADTISDMRHTAQDVGNRIQEVTGLAQALQEKHLIGFKTNDHPLTRQVNSTENISKVLEIKLLLLMPEQMWTAVDDERYTDAAELYRLAEHTHLGLHVARAAVEYPIVNSLWNTIVTCRLTILKSARERLPLLDLSPKGSADCLCCILMLESIKVEDALKEFLEIREEAFQKLLISDDNPTVKEKLHAAVQFVQQTFLVVCLSFLDFPTKKGLLEECFEKFGSAEAMPTVSKLPTVSPLADNYLTDIVKNFKSRPSQPVKSLSSVIVRDSLLQWMIVVQQIMKQEMNNLLGLIGNLSGIVAVRKKVSCVQKPTDWNFVEAVVGSYSVYSLLVVPHIADRTLHLISCAWVEAATAVSNAVAVLDEQLFKDGKDEKKQPENNIKWFTWRENDNNDVSLQTLGCTPRVSDLALALENSLKRLIDDVNIYCEEVDDKEQVLRHLSSCSFENIERLSNGLQDGDSLQDLSESSLIVRARLLHSIASQCPSLKKSVNFNDSKGSGSWQDMVTVLRSASESMWRLWITHITPQLKTIVTQNLDPDVAVSTFIQSRPVCEVVTITEEGEENQSVSSQLRVPSQPSLSLQEALYQVCLRLNAVAVHSIPRTIHQELIRLVISIILEHYNKLCSSDVIYQSHAWQLLLDVRFLALLFLSHDNQAEAQAISARLESIIDPFDLNVSFTYFQTNVKKCAIRLQGTFGVLVDHTEKLTVLNSLKVSLNTQSSGGAEEPTVVSVASNVPWFPLLPISSGANRKKEESPGRQNKPRAGKDSKKESMSSDFVKSAGAFFGAMTGGWS